MVVVLGRGRVVLGREDNIPGHLLCTRPCSRGLGDGNEKTEIGRAHV